MVKKKGHVMQHIEIREIAGNPAVVSVSCSVPDETNTQLVEKLMVENNFTEHEEFGDQAECYSPVRKLRKRTVLVVDDDEEALEEMVGTLMDYDLFVVSAKDGEEAIQEAKNHKPAYVVMDFNLPKLNGLDAVTTMRKFLPDTTYIMISGCMNFCRVATVKNTRTFAILQKPISMDGIGRFITVTNAASNGKPASIHTMVPE